MPSTNKLPSRIAKLLLSFCGIASFGVLSMMGILALGVLSVLSIGALSLSVLGSDAHAARVTSATTDVTVDLGASISVRVLDSTAAQEISLLAFDLTPTAAGVTSTKRAVVDVSTSNITGYKLYVEANGKDHNNNYTTDLVHSDTEDSHVIPTSVSSSSSNNFWNYVNPLISTTSVIPAHGTPDKINQETTPIDSSQTNIDINVGVDTTITAGTYSNQLLFTAIANEDSINYTLAFEPNPPSGVDPSAIENLPADQSASSVTTSHTFTLSSFTPTLAGYTFLGYVNPEADPGEKGSAADPYMPGESVIVYADTSTSSSAISGSMTLNLTWEAIPYYDVTVNAGTGVTATTGAGSYQEDDTVTVGYTLDAGYYFNGWTTVSGGVTVDGNNQFTMPANDVEVTANGAINTCPIIYNSNAPSGTAASGTTADSTMAYGQAATLTTNGYTVTGYQFDGWATTDSGTVAYSDGGPIPAVDTQSYCGTDGTTLTLYAHWTKMYTYTLNLNYNDGTTDKQILNYPSSGGTTDASHTFANLNNYAPSRSGYNFLGWATTTTGTSYVTSYTLNSSSASSTATSSGFPVTGNLYAIWQAGDITTITQMQQMTSAICANSATNASNTLTDTRDQNTYTVKKLADGKCWMTQNLRLAGQRTLTSSDSNVSSSWTLPAANTSFPTSCTNAAYNMSSGNTTYGNYYNWYAATAGTGTCAMTSGNATASICPKGWRLPTGGSSGDFQALYNQYASSALMRDANGPAFVLSGARLGSSTIDQGRYGAYWSSTAYDTNRAYYLLLDSSGVNPAFSNGKYYGLPVRCVAQ